jgi:multiple sugar transport system ATP-binding protein
MKAGHILQIGTPMEVYENPKNIFVGGFIGSPPMNFIDVQLVEAHGDLYLDAGDFKLAVPQPLGGISKARIDSQVVLGIRPDHINDLAYAIPDGGIEALEAFVEVIEPIGSEVILLVTAGQHQFTAKAHPQTKARLNQSIKLAIDMTKMHLFDRQTGEKIDTEAQV